MTDLVLSFDPAAPEALVAAIVHAEEAGATLVLIDYGTPRSPVDPLAVAAAAAIATKRIMLCVAAAPVIIEPFTFARGLAALDHLSGGRAAWRVVGSAGPFRASADPAQQAEFAQVVAALCESWDADALSDDKDNAAFWRAGAARRIGHEGANYQVAGPLNTPRPPQGVPLRVAWSGDALAAQAGAVIVRQGETVEGARSIVDVTQADGMAGEAGAVGYHARIDPADIYAARAFAAKFGKVTA